MHFWIQHNEISKTHLFWFLPQKKSFFLQASVINKEKFYIAYSQQTFSYSSKPLKLLYACILPKQCHFILYAFNTRI